MASQHSVPHALEDVKILYLEVFDRNHLDGPPNEGTIYMVWEEVYNKGRSFRWQVAHFASDTPEGRTMYHHTYYTFRELRRDVKKDNGADVLAEYSAKKS